MKLIAGLGNPGRQYENTPHNAGFLVADGLAETLGCNLRRSFWFDAKLGKVVYGKEPLLIVKPQTYMNRSGTAVSAVLRWHKLKPEDLIVVLDDADLPVGRLRIKPKGSSGGHKGLESVIGILGTDKFARVRLGIGRDEEGKDLVDHVLSPFSDDEQHRMDDVIKAAVKAVICIVESGVDAAMNDFNN